jgi:hypothetical protein
MAIPKQIYKVTRVVPVRFQRCGLPGLPRLVYAPDPDDRGYVRIEGPLVAMVRGDTCAFSVVREQLALNAPLYVSSSDASKLTVLDPPNNRPLPNGMGADVRVRAGNTSGDAKLRVHAQAQNGPIIAELTINISPLLQVHCAAHRTSLHSPSGRRTAANTTVRLMPDIAPVLEEVNRQWRPACIEFVTDTWRNTDMTNQAPCAGVNPTDGILLCPVYGTNTPNENFNRLMATNTVANRLNIYFVRGIQAANPGGGAGPNYIGFGSAYHGGMVIADNLGDVETTAHTLSHELGHILDLAGKGHTNSSDSHSDDDPQFSLTITDRRHDLWSRRRLMYYMVGLSPNERTGPGGQYAFAGTDVGYGPGRSGHMITIKDLANDPTDGEFTTSRGAAARRP